jgi:CTP synthase
VATQAHPELRSRPTRPHPLFVGLVGAALERQRELRFPIDESGLRRPPAARETDEAAEESSEPAGLAR